MFDTYVHWLSISTYDSQWKHIEWNECAVKNYFPVVFHFKKKVSTLKLFKLILHKIFFNMIFKMIWWYYWFDLTLYLYSNIKYFNCYSSVWNDILLYFELFFCLLFKIAIYKTQELIVAIHMFSDQKPIASVLSPRRTFTWRKYPLQGAPGLLVMEKLRERNYSLFWTFNEHLRRNFFSF